MTVVVDFKDNNLEVLAGTDKYVTLDMDGSVGEYLQVSGNLEINVFNFFTVSGGFALEKTTDTVTLDDGSNVNVDLLTIGASDVDAFIGMNGGSSDALGFAASEVNFAMAMMTDKTVGSDTQWISLQALVGTASFVGIDGLTISGSDLNLEINRVNDGDTDGSNDLYVDYLATSMNVKTGVDESITFTMDGSEKELTRVSGNLNINIFNFFSVDGGFALEKKTDTVKY